MNEAGDALCLCIAQNRKRRITAHAYNCIGPKAIDDLSDLVKTFHQLERQTNIFDQRASVESRYVQAFYPVTCLRHFFHFHFYLRPNKKDVSLLRLLPQSIRNGDRGKYMSPCSP